MTEMVERVARVLMQADCGMYPTQDRTWMAWRPDAIAAIEAMRNPTDAMQDAAEYQDRLDDGFWTDPNCYGRVWQAMIDAALSDSCA